PELVGHVGAGTDPTGDTEPVDGADVERRDPAVGALERRERLDRGGGVDTVREQDRAPDLWLEGAAEQERIRADRVTDHHQPDGWQPGITGAAAGGRDHDDLAARGRARPRE